jgi:hypothetical protein
LKDIEDVKTAGEIHKKGMNIVYSDSINLFMSGVDPKSAL